MIRVRTKEEIIKYTDGGTRNAGLTALKQGKPVWICFPNDDIDEVIAEIGEEINE